MMNYFGTNYFYKADNYFETEKERIYQFYTTLSLNKFFWKKEIFRYKYSFDLLGAFITLFIL